MKITDLNGKQIEVTDLAIAIEQAAYFKGCHHVPSRPIADQKRKAYWTDMFNKLIAQQNKLADNSQHKQ